VTRTPSSRATSTLFLQTSKASGSAGAPGVCGSRRPPAAAGLVDHLREAVADDVRRTLGVLAAHVRVAHQDGRGAAAAPGEDFEPRLVVVVVRALALRHVAPGACDVAGGKGVLEKVQREPSSASIARASAWRSPGASDSLASRDAFCSALR
jgi:hypothetical protein